jgi:hypothetical protein
MSEKNTGGPAYPSETIKHYEYMTYDGYQDVAKPIHEMHPGMTLRDYFAGQALAGLMTSYATAQGNAEQCIKAAAKISFLVADAMLQERDK